jgi:hypothetical protein
MGSDIFGVSHRDRGRRPDPASLARKANVRAGRFRPPSVGLNPEQEAQARDMAEARDAGVMPHEFQAWLTARHYARMRLEPPSLVLDPIRYHPERADVGVGFSWSEWSNGTYFGTVRRFSSGNPLGEGPWAVIGIAAADQTARHDWREFQQIKNQVVGPEWEAVEIYPSESKLVDPSNYFYLWCFPPGSLKFGLPGDTRRVDDVDRARMAQRPFSVPPAP